MGKMKKSFITRVSAIVLALTLVIGTVPNGVTTVFANNDDVVAKIGEKEYTSLEAALADVPVGNSKETPTEATIIELCQDTAHSFDVGTSNGTKPKNIELQLNGNILTLKPAVGSTGTVSNGIRVLAYSKLTITNGDVVCSSEESDNVKVGIANYGELVLDGVNLQSGALTLYTVNNRGNLTLKGKTVVENGQVAPNDYSDSTGLVAITNDPYDMYYSTPVDAVINCDSEDVVVGNIQIERYTQTNRNEKGDNVLNISAGSFGSVVIPEESSDTGIEVIGNITGGSFEAASGTQLQNIMDLTVAGAAYQTPEKSVSIKLTDDVENGFDVGNSNGTAPKYFKLDLNGKTITLRPAVGSVGTVSSGIRVLAYSKLEISNGNVVCSDEVEDNIKVGIANYGTLGLDSVNVQSGALTIYTINNRGKLTLSGETEVENAQVAQNDYANGSKYVAITNDPYTLYYTNDAIINCGSEDVVVGNIQLETYGSAGNIKLNISNGSFGEIVAPTVSESDKVEIFGNITGGQYGNDVSNYIPSNYEVKGVDGIYTVTQQLAAEKVEITAVNTDASVSASGRSLYNTETVQFTVNVTEDRSEELLQSGIKSVTYEIVAKDRADDEEYVATKSEILYTWEEGTKLSTEYIGTITVDSAEFNYNYVDLTVTVVDNAGNETTETYEFAIDITEPTIELSYDNNKVVGTEGEGGRGYFDAERTVTIVYTERSENWNQSKANEVLAKTVAKDVNGEDVEYTIKWEDVEGETSDADTHTATITFEDGVHYNVETPAYTDEAGNEAKLIVAGGTEYPYVFSIDEFDYAEDSVAEIKIKTGNWFNDLLNTLTFGVFDLFSNVDTDVTVNVKDDFSGIKEIRYIEKEYTDIVADTEGKYTLVLREETVRGYSEWNDEDKVITIINDEDKVLEETLEETIEKTLEGKDTNKNVVVFVNVIDYAGHDKILSSDGVIIDTTAPTPALTDNKLVLPETDADAKVPVSDRPLYTTDKVVFNVAVMEETIKTIITEASENTEEEAALVLQSGIKSVTYEIVAKDRADDEEYVATKSEILYTWEEGTKLSTEYIGTITVDSAEFNYNYVDLTVTVVDNAGNETTETYEFAIDITEPTIELSYDNNKVVGTEGEGGRGYFDAERTVTIVYTERSENWNQSKANEVLAKTVAKDVNGEDVEYTIKWEDVEGETSDADTHTATITFEDGVHYNVETPAYTDEAGNEAKLIVAGGTEYPYVFSIDEFDYAEDSVAEIKIKTGNWFNDLLNTLTFGVFDLFSNVDTDVTVNVKDDFSGIKEIRYIEKEYTDIVADTEGKYTLVLREETVRGYSEWNDEDKVITIINDEDKVLEETLEETIEKTLEGKDTNKNVVVFVNVIDYAGHDKILSSDGVIIDTTMSAGELDEGMMVCPSELPMNGETVVYVPNDTDEEKRPLYGKTAVGEDGVVTFDVNITEATIDGVLQSGIKKVSYKVEVKDREGLDKNGNEYQYVITQGAEHDLENVTEGDLYTWNVGETLKTEFKDTIEVDAVKNNYNYVKVTVTVTDNAGNTISDEYEIAIDITEPTVEISYNMNKLVDEANDLGYFNYQRVATIIYTERSENWNEEEAEREMVTALDINGNPVEGAYSIEWEDVEGVTSDEDKHIVTVSFNPTNILEIKDAIQFVEPVKGADARYELNLSYTDAAGNSVALDENGEFDESDVIVAEGTVHPFKFVIDTVSPEVVSIDYKETLKDVLINNLTFNYFAANVEVTVTLKDETAGINEFDYEGLLDSNISAKNKAVILTAVENADIMQQEDKSQFVVKFTIPKEALTELNSFRGTVRVNAWDYSDNTVQKHDETRLVVDKIAPTCQVTFDKQVNEVAGVSYYDKAFTATIAIDEANFYAEDVVITVNGSRVTPTDWALTEGTDIWTSHVSFTEEGDYILTVDYTDRSGNVMTSYESNQKTLDTTEPVINVTNIKHESANNEETIGFVVTIIDKNLISENVKPQATAVVREGDNSSNYTYKTINIDLGTPSVDTSANGETVYTYTVTNLEIDGYYSLLCTVVDNANHTVSNIGAQSEDNHGVAVEAVNFSVNREGSVFWIETIHNDKYSDTTYNNELNGAYANDEVIVKLHEVNVDRVDELAGDDKRTVLTLNDGNDANTITLVEDSDNGGNYERNVRIGEGGWYETIYTLNNDQFAKDGTYSLNIITYDKAENSNVNTNMKNDEGTIQFVVDRTNPVITTNVKSKQIIDANEYTVELTIAEVNLDESTLVVKLDGKETELTKVSSNTYQFTLDEAQWANFPRLSQNFEITAKDLAGNSAEVYQREDITVTDDVIIQIAAYMIIRPVLLGAIGAGIVAIAGLIIFLIVSKKRKKDEDKA